MHFHVFFKLPRIATLPTLMCREGKCQFLLGVKKTVSLGSTRDCGMSCGVPRVLDTFNLYCTVCACVWLSERKRKCGTV
jgi:hypothetical protein